jgi:hypothetical protein
MANEAPTPEHLRELLPPEGLFHLAWLQPRETNGA